MIYILILGTVLLPFFVWPGMDTREPKFLLASAFCMLIGLKGLYSGFRPYRNVWLLVFFAFLPVNSLLSPNIGVFISDIPAPSWVLQAGWYALVFFLAHIAISGTSFTASDTSKILWAMVWAGTGMAIYAVLQFFHFEQFFVGPQGTMCGTLGNPAVLAAFLAMLIPIALYLRAWWSAALMTLVVGVINSQMACGALVVSLVFLIGARNKSLMPLMLTILAITTAMLFSGYHSSPKIRQFIGDNGRFAVWEQIITDVKTSNTPGKAPRAITGIGFGSFPYLFHSRHPEAGLGETFLEAHSEYFELLYNTGVAGLAIFLAAIIWFIRSCFPLTRLKAYLLTSFICIAICAGGLFVWQNGAIIYYTVVITGILTGRNYDNSTS